MATDRADAQANGDGRSPHGYPSAHRDRSATHCCSANRGSAHDRSADCSAAHGHSPYPGATHRNASAYGNIGASYSYSFSYCHTAAAHTHGRTLHSNADGAYEYATFSHTCASYTNPGTPCSDSHRDADAARCWFGYRNYHLLRRGSGRRCGCCLRPGKRKEALGRGHRDLEAI